MFFFAFRDLAGDYFCQCNDGYGGKNCTVALTGCITNICYNEGSCTPVYDEVSDQHSFECRLVISNHFLPRYMIYEIIICMNGIYIRLKIHNLAANLDTPVKHVKHAQQWALMAPV